MAGLSASERADQFPFPLAEEYEVIGGEAPVCMGAEGVADSNLGDNIASQSLALWLLISRVRKDNDAPTGSFVVPVVPLLVRRRATASKSCFSSFNEEAAGQPEIAFQVQQCPVEAKSRCGALCVRNVIAGDA